MSKLKSLREAKSLSQADVAVAVGVSPQAVSKWEREESDPQWAFAPKLAELFGCSIDELFGREPPERTSA